MLQLYCLNSSVWIFSLLGRKTHNSMETTELHTTQGAQVPAGHSEQFLTKTWSHTGGKWPHFIKFTFSKPHGHYEKAKDITLENDHHITLEKICRSDVASKCLWEVY